MHSNGDKTGPALPAASEKGPPDDASRRRVTTRALGSVSSLLMLAIVLMANYLAFRHYTRFDWTRQHLYTLSEKSVSVLRALKTDVDIYLFMSRGEPNFADTEELLKRYRAASGRVRVHFVDPDREPAEFQMLAQRFGLSAGVLIQTGDTVVDVAAVVAAGDRKWSVKRSDLISWEPGAFDDGDEQSVSVKAEQALTGAVIQVTSGRPTRICHTRGHGEWTAEMGEERSFEPLKDMLRHDNIQWEPIETLGKKRIPDECDAVVVMGPSLAFPEEEAEVLAEYVRKGGNLLLALDPVIERDQIQVTGFEKMARGFGIIIDRTLAIEMNEGHLLSPNAVEFLATEFGDHRTTRPLANNGRVFVALARSVRPDQGSVAEILFRSSAESFAETDISQVRPGSEPVPDEHDLKGPVSLAVAAQAGAESDETASEDRTGGRLIVIGDSDFFQGALLGSPDLANSYLAGAWIGWISERDTLIAIPPKKAGGGTVMFTQDALDGLLFRVVVLLPAVVLIAGFAVWLNRRS